MIKRTIEISQQALHLAVRHEQLLLQEPGLYAEVVSSFPCEDIGLVVVDHPGSSYSHAALAKLIDAGAALVVCDAKHLPAGILLPFSSHTEVVWRLQDQINLPKPRRKQLWRQIVVAKIRNQAANLDHHPEGQRRLRELARKVKSGDPANIEAQAARLYWSLWLGEGSQFQRRPEGGDGVNILLNYGYAIVRAAVARALVGGGLFPALGLFHAHRSNSFCLADDFMEPLRPLVDDAVHELIDASPGPVQIDRAAKVKLLGLLAAPVLMDGQVGPLMVQLHRSVASLARCMAGPDEKLSLIQHQFAGLGPEEPNPDGEGPWTLADIE